MFVISQDGSGDFTTIQAAVDAVPDGGTRCRSISSVMTSKPILCRVPSYFIPGFPRPAIRYIPVPSVEIYQFRIRCFGRFDG